MALCGAELGIADVTAKRPDGLRNGWANSVHSSSVEPLSNGVGAVPETQSAADYSGIRVVVSQVDLRADSVRVLEHCGHCGFQAARSGDRKLRDADWQSGP